MDEERPLLAPDTNHKPGKGRIIDFDPNGDPDNPLEWSKAYKYGIVLLLSFMAFTVTFTCIGIVPIASHIISDLAPSLPPDQKSTPTILLVTIWELGEALGPLLIGPLSESIGRLPTLLFTNMFFSLTILLSIYARSIPLLITSRFLTGFFVASNVLNPAIIGDVFRSEERGGGMSLIMLAPLIGGAVGPAIGGAVAETFGWRIVLWGAFVASVLVQIVIFVWLRETYKVTILRKRVGRLRAESGDEGLKCVFDFTDQEALEGWATKARKAVGRPVMVMWNSRVLKVMALFGGYAFTFYYVVATTLPIILETTYGFSPSMTGASFLCFNIGAALGLVTCNLIVDRIYIYLSNRHPSTHLSPAYRLPILIIGSLIMPFIIFLYGLTPILFPSTPIPFLIVVVLFGYIMLVVWVPLASYIIDAFGVYSASAMTIILIVRNASSTVFPMVVPWLERGLGLGGAFGVLGVASAVVAMGPLGVWLWGERWRRMEKMGEEEEDVGAGVERD